MDSTSQQSTPRIEDSNVHDPGKMFVGGLSWNTTSDTLKEYFCKFGEVRECMIMRDPESKRSRGFGFVTFVDPLSVDQVLQSGDHRVDDKKVDPKKAIPKKAQVKPVTRTKKMFIGGLSQQTTVEDLKAYFAKYGQVEEASLMIDKNTKRSRGFGFIVFESEDIVDKVTEDHFHEVNNKMVETKKAQPKEVMQPHQNAKAKALMRGLCSSFYGFPYPAPLFIDQPGLKVNPSPFHQAGFHQLPRGAAYACAPVSPYVAVAVNGFAQGFLHHHPKSTVEATEREQSRTAGHLWKHYHSGRPKQPNRNGGLHSSHKSTAFKLWHWSTGALDNYSYFSQWILS
ncbi:hypothetical protein BSL78_13001, partial [Apostichopus japonicus]